MPSTSENSRRHSYRGSLKLSMRSMSACSYRASGPLMGISCLAVIAPRAARFSPVIAPIRAPAVQGNLIVPFVKLRYHRCRSEGGQAQSAGVVDETSLESELPPGPTASTSYQYVVEKPVTEVSV